MCTLVQGEPNALPLLALELAACARTCAPDLIPLPCQRLNQGVSIRVAHLEQRGVVGQPCEDVRQGSLATADLSQQVQQLLPSFHHLHAVRKSLACASQRDGSVPHIHVWKVLFRVCATRAHNTRHSQTVTLPLLPLLPLLPGSLVATSGFNSYNSGIKGQAGDCMFSLQAIRSFCSWRSRVRQIACLLSPPAIACRRRGWQAAGMQAPPISSKGSPLRVRHYKSAASKFSFEERNSLKERMA